MEFVGVKSSSITKTRNQISTYEYLNTKLIKRWSQREGGFDDSSMSQIGGKGLKIVEKL